MNWHKTNATKTANKNRAIKAHIVDNDRYGFYAICGKHIPRVTVDKSDIANPDNNVCKRCAAKIETN